MTKEEVCSSCHQPVSSMDRVIANKALLHHLCFCCKLCKRKLSLQNYTALHGAFYCKVHYEELAKAGGGSEEEKIVYKQDLQQHARQTLGLGSQSRNTYNRTEEKTVVREKLQPRSFHSHPHLSAGPPAGMRQLSSEFVSRKQFGTSWPPLKKSCAEADRKPSKPEKNEGRGTALNLQAYETADSRAAGVRHRRRDGKSVAEMAVKKKPSLLPRVTWLKEEGQGLSWVKAEGGKGELGNGKRKPELMEGKGPRAPQGSRVLEKVTVFQQSKPMLERKSGPAIPPLALVPMKPPAHGRFISHSKALRGTGAANLASRTAVRADALCTTNLLPKANELSVTRSSEGLFNEGNTNPSIKRAEPVPKMIVSSPELTLSTSLTTQDQQHPEDVGSDQLATHVPGEAETHGISNTVPECGTRGHPSSHRKPEAQMQPAENDAVKGKETICLPSGSVTYYSVTDSSELAILQPLHQTAEQVNEDAKTNGLECSRNLMPITYEANIQGCRRDLKNNGAEVENAKKMQAESKECYDLVEHAPGHISQESKEEGKAISSAGQAGGTDDQTGLQEVGSQNMYDPLINTPQGDILIDNIKPSTRDISGSMDTHLNAAHTTVISHDEPSSSENTKIQSKDQDDTLRQSICPISEPLGKKLEAFSSNELADTAENQPVGNGNVDEKLQHKSESQRTASASQGKETENGHARKDTLAKVSSPGKNPFARLFASDNKGSTTNSKGSATKKELSGKKKPTKPQSALVTLFGYSSSKTRNQKESCTKPSPKLSAQTDNGDQQESSQRGNSSSHSMQKPFKNEDASDAVTQTERAEATPQDSQPNFGYHVGDRLRGSFLHLDSPGDLGTDVLSLAPHADILSNARNLHEVSCLEFHDQGNLNVQTVQRDDGGCSSLIPSGDFQEKSPVTSEARQPPMGLMVAADTNTSLTSQGNHYDTCLYQMENLGGLDDQDSKIKTGTFSTLSHLGESHKEVDLPLEDTDLLGSNTLFFSTASSNLESPNKHFAGISSIHVQLKDSPSSKLNSSELQSASLSQDSEHELLLKSSSFLLMEEDDHLNIEDTHGIRNSEMIQQFVLNSQLQMDTDDPFGLGLDTRQPTTDHLHTSGCNVQPMSSSTPHIAEPPHAILDTGNTEATAAL